MHDFPLGHGFVEHDPAENVLMHATGIDEPGQAFNPTHLALLPLIPTLNGEQRQRVTFAMVPPMLLLGLVPDHMFWFIVLPNGPNEISLRIGLCVPPESTQVRNFGK